MMPAWPLVAVAASFVHGPHASFGAARAVRAARHCTAAAAPNPDPYSVLGVGRSATAAEIKRAYRKLALRNHPDVNKAADAGEVFARIAAAYSILSDPKQRAVYDSAPRRAAAGSRWSSTTPRRRPTGGGGQRSAYGEYDAGAAASARAERARRARERERAEADAVAGDSFGALLGDLVGKVVGEGLGKGDWISLLEDLSPGSPAELDELLRVGDAAALEAELEESRFVARTLNVRIERLVEEARRIDTEARSWAARPSTGPPGSVGGELERQLRKEARAKRARADEARRLLSRCRERERRLSARLDDVRAGRGARGAGRAAAPGPGARASPPPGARPSARKRLPSVEEELRRMKREMDK